MLKAPMLRYLIALLCAIPAAAQDRDFTWRGSVAHGRLIEIRGINGDVFAEASATGEVEVVATIAEGSSAGQRVHVQLFEHSEGVTVCTIQGPGGCEESDTPKSGVRVNYTVRVPEGVRFRGRTVNGGVEAQSLRSDVEAYTVNGPVRISTTGSAQARTVNGAITASLLNPFAKPYDFAAVNGAIVVNLPARINTAVRAETRNGVISTDFLSRLRGQVSDRKIDARIGAGGAGVTLKTVNGSIRIRRAG